MNFIVILARGQRKRITYRITGAATAPKAYATALVHWYDQFDGRMAPDFQMVLPEQVDQEIACKPTQPGKQRQKFR